jgi:hypothetical protein
LNSRNHSKLKTFAQSLEILTLALLLATIPAPALLGEDFYLARLGPAPLRFAAAPANPNGFTWPVPLIPVVAGTNSTNPATSIAATNSAAASANAIDLPTPTNSAVAAPVTGPATLSPFLVPQTAIGSNENPLPASNLLVVTPQMLADFFRANLDGPYMPSTNVYSGAEVFFNPPILRLAPSSQATYRTQ